MDVDGPSGPPRLHARGRGRGRAHGASHDGSDHAADAHAEDAEDDDDDDATAVEDTPRVNTRRPPMPPRELERGLGRGALAAHAISPAAFPALAHLACTLPL
ncbi:hypothetical protein PsYK624_159800 [Phanerochaete sordida]|uniref:Uncharacterized protein n=1 Tax=Phanerochaete sordida TaxID=48140 RepID=A0A9P3GUK8_9APHY|nr:hypothetical protein PsYK624_159800 [Phanerochaete sordida]